MPIKETKKINCFFLIAAGLLIQVVPVLGANFKEIKDNLISEYVFKETQASKNVIVRKVAAPPKIDGKLETCYWEKTVRVDDFQLLGSGKPENRTIAYLGYDNDALYIFFKCYESQMDKLTAQIREHEDRIWSDDCIEIFLDTNLDRTTYYHFLANAIGTKGESNSTQGSGWNGKWEVKNFIGNDFWTAEIAIPFRSLSIKAPKPGTVWGINLCREETPKRELITWSDLIGGFHRPKDFGFLFFGQSTPASSSLDFSIAQEEYFSETKGLSGKATFEMSGKGMFIKADMARADGTILTEDTISSIPYARGSIDITFDISNLPVGKYRLRLSLFDQKKKRVATSVKDFDILPAFY